MNTVERAMGRLWGSFTIWRFFLATQLLVISACLIEERDDPDTADPAEPNNGSAESMATNSSSTTRTTGIQSLSVDCAPSTNVTVTNYDDRAAFEAALADRGIRVVDFDDIDTSTADPVPFATDRYADSHGAVIVGTDGQYVDEQFSYPEDFRPVSAPNQYAPGPKHVRGKDAGGHGTDVTFRASDRAGCVAGFGVVFIDADFSGIARSSIALFDGNNKLLGANDDIDGDDGSQLFRGMIAADKDGQPVPTVARVHLVNGNEWPERATGEGVTLDDMVFDRPVNP